MRGSSFLFGCVAVAVAACGAPDVKMSETSEQGHLAAAAKEKQEAKADFKQYDPYAERTTQVGGGGPAGAEGVSGILVTVNPTTGHLLDADAHAQHAKQHERAAIALEKFESVECKSVPPAERLSCPTVMSDSLVTLVNGVRMHVGPKRLPVVLAYMRCHLAFGQAHGYGDDALCPFAIKGVVANAAADQTGVELTSTDPAAVKALHDLILIPFKGL